MRAHSDRRAPAEAAGGTAGSARLGPGVERSTAPITGLRRRLVGGAVGVVVGLLATFALRAVMGDGGGAASNGASGGRTTATTPSATAALWLFGFDTVRVDPDTFDHAHRLGRPGFGEVRAYGGMVYMASRASGRVGVLDATTNEMSEVDGPPTDRKEGAESNLAVTEGRLWLVTGDGAVTSITRDRFDDPATVDAGGGGASGETRVVSVSRRSVVVVVESPFGLRLALLSEGGRLPQLTVSVRAGRGAVRGVAAGGGRVWIVQPRELRWFDTSALGEGGSAQLPSGTGEARGVAATGGDAWVLVANGARLLRYGAGSAAPEAMVRVVADVPRPFRAGTAVVAGRGAIWALVPTGSDPGDHGAAIVRVDPESDSVGERLDAPSALFVGAIAVT